MSARKKAQQPNYAELPLINPDAAGLDVHAAEIWACVPRDRAEQPIRSFSTYTPDLHALADWLQACGIKTVAMESTGVYWIPVYEVLEARGFVVYLVNARQIKNVSGRKSDVSDCQWIQTLHSYGLLGNSFLPERKWRTLRAYWRERATLIEHRAAHIQHMQKAMQQMNVQLTVVLSDVTGVTGMAIMRAIAAGERDPHKLAAYRDHRCAHSQEEIVKALTGNYRAEHVFALKQALALYDFYTTQIAECDAEMERVYAAMQGPTPPEQGQGTSCPPRPRGKRHCKNAPAFDVRGHVYRLTGVDLTAITGLEENTVQTIISEIGTDMSCWPSAKHFASWLGLAPHKATSAGKDLGRNKPKKHNRAGQAFRLAAQSQMRSHTAFGAFFRRLAARIGREQATVATAHKIARTVYAVLKRRVPFQDLGEDEYERRYRDRVIARLRKRAAALGFQLLPNAPASEALSASSF